MQQRFASGDILALIAISVFGALVRCQGLSHSLWLDELTTAWVIRDGYGPIYERSWLNNLSPLYYYLCRISTDLFGYSEFGLRLPSVIAGVLTIPMTYFVALRLTASVGLALFAALVAAFHPTLVFYSLEVRPYNLVILVALVQSWCFLNLFEQPRWSLTIGLGITSALLLYLHYTAALFLAAECLFLVLAGLRDGSGRDSWRSFILGFGLGAVLCLPLLFHLQYLFGNRGTLGSWVEGKPIDNVFGRFGTLRLLVAPIMLAGLVEFSFRREPTQMANGSWTKPGHALAFLTCWFLFPSAVVWILTKSSLVRIDVDRYVISSVVAPILASAVILGLLQSRAARGTYVGVVLFFFVLVPGLEYLSLKADAYRPEEDWAGAVAALNKQRNDDLPVFIRSGLVEAQWLRSDKRPLMREYVLAPVNSVYFIRTKAKLEVEPLIPGSGDAILNSEQIAHFRRLPGAWFILVAPKGPQEWLQLQRDFADLGIRSQAAWFSPHAGVLAGKLTFEPSPATAPKSDPP